MGPPSPAAPDGCDKLGLLPQGPLSCRTWRRGTAPSALPGVPPHGWGLRDPSPHRLGAVGEGLCCSLVPSPGGAGREALLLLPLWEPGGLRLSQAPPAHWLALTRAPVSTAQLTVPALATRTQASPVARQLALDKERPGPAVPEPLCCGFLCHSHSHGFSVGRHDPWVLITLRLFLQTLGGRVVTVRSLGPASLRLGDGARHAGLLTFWMQQEHLFHSDSHFPKKIHSPSSSLVPWGWQATGSGPW